MSKRILKSIIIISIVIITMLILTTVSNAASLSISTSKSSVSPGEVFTVTVTLNGGAGPVSASVSNGAGSGGQFLDNGSFSFSCTAGSSGTVSIYASGTVGDYATEVDTFVDKSASVNIVVPQPEPPPQAPVPSTKPSTSTSNNKNTNTNKTTSSNNTTTTTVKKSDNSKLERLEIAEGVITPEFDNSVKEYSINVGNDITKLSIAAVADSSKATVSITGNEELQVGDNIIEIVVKAEDGSTSTYKILAKRAEPELSLQTLTVSYTDKNGEKVDLILNPEFIFNMYEYSIDTILPHTVKTLDVVSIANRENAKIEIIGNEELKTGENLITIKVTLTDEAGLEEQKTYTLKVEKEEEPVVVPLTTMDKIKNWFNGAGTTISAWLTQNFNKIITGMLLVATITLVGLTVYFAYDYKNYKNILAKLAQLNKENLMERANIALDPESLNTVEENMETTADNEIKEMEKIKGKRFK